MKRFCSIASFAVVAIAALACVNGRSAHARKEYKDEFVKKYVTETPTTPAQKALDEHVKAVNCGVCHMGEKGKDKKKRNAYGESLGKLLKKEKDAEKINAALDTAAKEHSDADKQDSPTFGELIEKGELPVK